MVRKISNKIRAISYRWQMGRFEKNINQSTLRNHVAISEWSVGCMKTAAINLTADMQSESGDPIVLQGRRLNKETRSAFKNKLSKTEGVRILIHLPPAQISPGGFSLFNNLIQSLEFIGIEVKALEWDGNISDALAQFKPSVFITSDHPVYLGRIDWPALQKHKRANKLMVGLTASLEQYGNSPLKERLDRAEKNGIDFFYSFRDKDYLTNRKEYRPFHDRGFSILTVEFGANPLFYYPVPDLARDLDYVFLASANQDKWRRYFSYLKTIFTENYGYIDGPGWGFSSGVGILPHRDRYLYARAKVGLNLHLQEQIDWPCELNERTYQLAACGVPQLLDDPALLNNKFSRECFFSTGSPGEYRELFDYILEHPDQARERALAAQREVYARHTTFHRAEQFVLQLKEMF